MELIEFYSDFFSFVHTEREKTMTAKICGADFDKFLKKEKGGLIKDFKTLFCENDGALKIRFWGYIECDNGVVVRFSLKIFNNELVLTKVNKG